MCFLYVPQNGQRDTKPCFGFTVEGMSSSSSRFTSSVYKGSARIRQGIISLRANGAHALHKENRGGTFIIQQIICFDCDL